MTAKTKATLSAEQAALFADNTIGLITALDQRTVAQDMIDSAATLLDDNVFSSQDDSSSPTTGAIVITGGLGVGKSLYVGGALYSNTYKGPAVLTGFATAPTMAPNDNSSNVATTAFVASQIVSAGIITPSNATPQANGVGAAGVATAYSRGDHVHPISTITLTGDITGSGTTTINTTLATVNTNVGTFQGIAVNGKGLVTGATSIASTTAPAMDGTAAVGTSGNYARADHVHPTDTNLPAVHYDISQSLTSTQQLQASNNILAVCAAAVQSLTASQQTQARANCYAAPFDALAYNGMQYNGSMDVSQLNGANAVTTNNVYTVDGWQIAIVGPAASVQQVTDAPPGYASSLKVSVTTADPSPAASDALGLWQTFEGYRVSRLAFGKASASPVAIGFWVKANRTGNYSGSLQKGDSTRCYAFLFAVNNSATWEFKAVTIPGDTAGTWVTNNTAAMYFNINVMAGSSNSFAPNAWTATGGYAAIGAINGAAATTDYIQITGVIVLPGIELPSAARAPLIMRPYDQELLLSQRYLWCSNITAPKGGSIGALAGYPMVANSIALNSFRFTVPMRLSPNTLAIWNNGVQNQVRNSSTGAVISIGAVNDVTHFNPAGGSYIGLASGLTAGQAWVDFDMIADARM